MAQINACCDQKTCKGECGYADRMIHGLGHYYCPNGEKCPNMGISFAIASQHCDAFHREVIMRHRLMADKIIRLIVNGGVKLPEIPSPDVQCIERLTTVFAGVEEDAKLKSKLPDSSDTDTAVKEHETIPKNIRDRCTWEIGVLARPQFDQYGRYGHVLKCGLPVVTDSKRCAHHYEPKHERKRSKKSSKSDSPTSLKACSPSFTPAQESKTVPVVSVVPVVSIVSAEDDGSDETVEDSEDEKKKPTENSDPLENAFKALLDQL